MKHGIAGYKKFIDGDLRSPLRRGRDTRRGTTGG